MPGNWIFAFAQMFVFICTQLTFPFSLVTGLCPTSGLVRLFSVGFYLEESSHKGIHL